MRPSNFQRKIALIRYLCAREDDYPTGGNTEIKMLKVTRNTLDNWLKGQTNGQKQKLEVAEAGVMDVIRRTSPDEADSVKKPLTSKLGVMALGKLLGLTRAECRYAIDEAVGEIAPTYTIFSMDDNASSTYFAQLGGLYKVHRAERTETAKKALKTDRETSVMVIPMSVRHELQGHKFMSKTLRRIRCKLHIPAYNSSSSFHEYDGFITPLDGSRFHHWFFQSRKDPENDVIYLLTDELKRDGFGVETEDTDLKFLIGTMVSRSQDAGVGAVVWPIVAEKVMSTKDLEQGDDGNGGGDGKEGWGPFEDAESYFMRTTPDMIDPDDLDPLLREKLEEAKSFVTVMAL